MSGGWNAFLAGRGARLDAAGQPAGFDDPATEAGAVGGDGAVAALADGRLLLARGRDAEPFLQGQLTNDLNAITGETHGLGAYCNVKGRVLSVFRMARRGDGWLFVLPAGVLAATRARLETYRMRAEVDFEEPGELARFGIAGDAAADALARHLGPLPEGPGGARAHGDVTVLALADAPPRLELVGPQGALREAWDAVSRAATPVGPEAWRLLDVRAGLPFVTEATAEAFIPQMLNLDLVGAVSFQKGCFPGQEVVARTQHLGAVKRRLRRLRCGAAGGPLVPGAPLRAVGGEGERDGGRVVTAAADAGGGAELLAVVPIDAPADALRVASGDGPRLEPLALPYAVS